MKQLKQEILYLKAPKCKCKCCVHGSPVKVKWTWEGGDTEMPKKKKAKKQQKKAGRPVKSKRTKKKKR